MRTVLAAIFVMLPSFAQAGDDAPQGTGILQGKKITFPEKGIEQGVKATVGLLESCRSSSVFDADELKKALKEEHVRLVFAKPITAEVVDKKVEFAELVFRLPLNTGVFWVRAPDGWQRYSMYEPEKEKPFVTWLREAEPAM